MASYLLDALSIQLFVCLIILVIEVLAVHIGKELKEIKRSRHFPADHLKTLRRTRCLFDKIPLLPWKVSNTKRSEKIQRLCVKRSETVGRDNR